MVFYFIILKKYYLYRHIRLDTSEVFYVGIGTKNNIGVELQEIYKRGYLKAPSKRSKFWTSVFKASNCSITVDILFETNKLELIKQKEVEFIEIYGRRDLGLGTLVNHTDGGDGIEGYRWSDKQKELRSSQMLGNKNHFFGKQHSLKVVEFLRLKAKKEYENSKIKEFKNHTKETKDKLSMFGKERAAKGLLPILPTHKGEENHFSKNIVAISPNDKEYIIKGGIKDFCKEFELSYEFCKKFRDKGKCFLVDVSRARKLSKNTVGWEFKTHY